MEKSFKGILVSQVSDGFEAKVTELSTALLPKNDVLIKVHYSSLNYKDALSAAGNRGVTRNFPHVPGIDASGEVVTSNSELFRAGDQVIVTGFDLGMNTWGGFGAYITVPANWIIKLPAGLSLNEAMCYGTAGLTAALSVKQILDSGIQPEMGKIAVSGAMGGVGSIATAILSKLGFEVTAISGRAQNLYLTKTLGAKETISREEFIQTYDAKPISSTTFIAGIDTVGGKVLSGMIKSATYGSRVTCCGNVASPSLETSIFPFILRGVQLIGVDSVQAPISLREKIWHLLSSEWKPENLIDLAQKISLDQVPDKLELMRNGNANGRYLLVHENI